MWIFKVLYIPAILYGDRIRSFSILILILYCNLTPTLQPQFHENGNHIPNLSMKAPSSNKPFTIQKVPTQKSYFW